MTLKSLQFLIRLNKVKKCVVNTGTNLIINSGNKELDKKILQAIKHLNKQY